MPKQISKARRAVEGAARKLNKASGATKLAKFVGEGIAKKKNPAVKRTVTKKQALKSGAKTALTIATLGTGGAGARALKATARRKVGKGITHNSSKGFLKRSVSGFEKSARAAAKKRRKRASK